MQSGIRARSWPSGACHGRRHRGGANIFWRMGSHTGSEHVGNENEERRSSLTVHATADWTINYIIAEGITVLREGGGKEMSHAKSREVRMGRGVLDGAYRRGADTESAADGSRIDQFRLPAVRHRRGQEGVASGHARERQQPAHRGVVAAD